MRKTLWLRLAAPLQSWGTECKFLDRRTEICPTKSGVVGLLAAALGRRRDADLKDLSALEFGVRVDHPGRIAADYQTAKHPTNKVLVFVLHRYYLEDAVFLAGVSSDRSDFLEEIAHALRHPAFPLFLGRRSCPPTLPLFLHIAPLPLEEALRQEPWLVPEWPRRKLTNELEIYVDGHQGDSRLAVWRDAPASFDPHRRQHSFRMVSKRENVRVDEVTEHDPFSE